MAVMKCHTPRQSDEHTSKDQENTFADRMGQSSQSYTGVEVFCPGDEIPSWKLHRGRFRVKPCVRVSVCICIYVYIHAMGMRNECLHVSAEVCVLLWRVDIQFWVY